MRRPSSRWRGNRSVSESPVSGESRGKCDAYRETRFVYYGWEIQSSVACGYRSVVQMLVPNRFRWSATDLASLALFCALASACHAQSNGVVCRDGSGSFEAAFPTGVTVQVGAERRDGLATRACGGTLLWDKQKLGVAAAA